MEEGKLTTGEPFKDAKSSGVLDANLGRVPVLVIDFQTEVGQSAAIERYVARSCELMGSGAVEGAQIEMWAEHVRELKDKYKVAKAGGTKPQFFSETLPAEMAKLERIAAGGDGLVGGKLTYADVSLFWLVHEFFDDKVAAAAAVQDCTKLSACISRVAEHPNVVAYLAQRPASKL